MASKEKQLWAAVQDMADWTGKEALLLQAVARMLAYNKRPTRAKPAKIPAGPAKGIQARMQLEVDPDYLRVGTYDAGDLRLLDTKIGSIHDFSDEDVTKLIDWINDGGLSFWETTPNFTHLVKHFTNWVDQAREWADEPRIVKDPRGSALR